MNELYRALLELFQSLKATKLELLDYQDEDENEYAFIELINEKGEYIQFVFDKPNSFSFYVNGELRK